MKRINTPVRMIYVLLISLLLTAFSYRDEGTAHAVISMPDTEKFPSVSVFLNPFDNNNEYISGLTGPDVFILENGKQMKIDSLDSLATPLSFVLAINSSPALDMRNSLGDAPYDSILSALGKWVDQLPENSPDKFALVWNGGVVGSRLSPADWRSRLDGFDPVLRGSKTSLDALGYALDAAQEAEDSPGIKKSVLLVTAHLSEKDIEGLKSLGDRARNNDIRIFVWVVDSKIYLSSPGSLALDDLALSTGGRTFKYSGTETIPDPESWLSSLRTVYRLAYTSLIRQGGDQTLSIQVNHEGQAISSNAVTFHLDLQPPSAALLSPPMQIVRQNPDSPFDLESFLPAAQPLSILVEFPDGRSRQLKRTTLFLDGEILAENTSEPFNNFTWDISGIKVTGEHLLKVEVEDILGLSRMSAEVPVTVTVVEPPGGIAGLILRNRTAVSISFLVLAGAVVLAIIVLGGRKGLASIADRRRAANARKDPVTQPVSSLNAETGAARPNTFPWLRHKDIPVPAYFIRLEADGSPGKGDPIPLAEPEITFGTDPVQSLIILDHPSLSMLHARLRRLDNGDFTLQDEKSTAGTWVNYDRVQPGGQILKHGDMIKLGSLTFRFVLTKPPLPVQPKITPVDPA